MKIYASIHIEGGLFGPDVLDALANADLPGQRAQDFGLPARRNMTDDIAAAFNDARTLWGVFQNRLARLAENDPATTLTRDSWVIPFLGLLGYELRYNPRAYEVDGLTFAVSHRAGEADGAPPVHVVGARQKLGQLAPSGRPRLSPHALVQEYLNRSECLWGITTNGQTLRILRDSTYVRRQAYVEFDLAAIFAEERFADFVILYRLLHRTRLPQPGEEARQCWLEQYYIQSVEQGGRVREHLRAGVEACLVCLANGFLRHPHSEALRSWVRAEEDPSAFYRELLRLVYRLLFLLVSEERGLISANPLYLEHYGVTRLRRLVDERAAYTEDDDLWQSLRVLWMVQSEEKLAELLQLAPLNGELFAPLHIDAATLTNRDLLDAFWRLAYYQESQAAPPRRVNYAALDTEELGSVYESLLEFHPVIDWSGRIPNFDLSMQGGERRSTGSHYTPPELVLPLIQNALEPVLAERLKNAQTRKQKESAILSIKVCDPACGSGHFLLAAARRLGKELARVSSGEDEPAPERVHEAIREVMAHCIYGVDKNPLAIELCRVALWLESHAGGKPLTFLDHHIRCGDSLVGVIDLGVLKAGIPDEAFRPVQGDDRALAGSAKRQNRAEREGQMGLFAWNLAATLQELSDENSRVEAIEDDTPEQVRKKARQYQRRYSDPAWLRQKQACDLWAGAFFQPYQPRQPLISSAHVHERLRDQALAPQTLAQAAGQAEKERFFHWPIEFPEVLAHGGFDVLLGNPPFMGGLRISGEFGSRYRGWLEAAFDPFGGTADLCAAFFRQAFELLKPGGRFGMIATNTIGQGDTRESGLAELLKQEGSITFARRFVRWPGRANVEVNLATLRKGKGKEACDLDGRTVAFISSRLDDEPEAEAQVLEGNAGKAFIGDFVRGIGFVLEPAEAQRLLVSDPRNADCLFPYLNGEDLNSHPEQQPSRWVICFKDWPLERAQEYPEPMAIVETRVKPEREQLQHRDDLRDRERWWLFARYRIDMRPAIANFKHALGRSRVSELHMLEFVDVNTVFGDALVVFAFDDDYHFALLQSGVHEVWLRKQASSLRTDIRYTPTDCFVNFPFPAAEYAGQDLDALLGRPAFSRAQQAGAAYHAHRRQVMQARQIGLTRTYNLFNQPECGGEDIRRLRELHAAMDNAVLACYGWQELDLKHDFYPNERGQTRFSIAPDVRRELLRRLLDLNLEIAKSERSTAEPPGAPGPADTAPRKKPARRTAAAKAPRAIQEKGAAYQAGEDSPNRQLELGFAALEPAAAQDDANDFGLYRCSACGKRVLGFDRRNHSETEHAGKSVSYQKL